MNQNEHLAEPQGRQTTKILSLYEALLLMDIDAMNEQIVLRLRFENHPERVFGLSRAQVAVEIEDLRVAADRIQRWLPIDSAKLLTDETEMKEQIDLRNQVIMLSSRFGMMNQDISKEKIELQKILDGMVFKPLIVALNESSNSDQVLKQIHLRFERQFSKGTANVSQMMEEISILADYYFRLTTLTTAEVLAMTDLDAIHEQILARDIVFKGESVRTSHDWAAVGNHYHALKKAANAQALNDRTQDLTDRMRASGI